MKQPTLTEFLKEGKRKKKRKGKRRRNVYGLDWAMTGALNISGEGGGLGEASNPMLGGVIPGTYSANQLGNTQVGTMNGRNKDMKKENRRDAPKKLNLPQWLRMKATAEDQEDDYYDSDDEWAYEELDDEEGPPEELLGDEEFWRQYDRERQDWLEQDIGGRRMYPEDEEDLEDPELEDEYDEEYDDEFDDEPSELDFSDEAIDTMIGDLDAEWEAQNGDAGEMDEFGDVPGGRVVSWWREHPVGDVPMDADYPPTEEDPDFEDDEFEDELDDDDLEASDDERGPRFRDMVDFGDRERDREREEPELEPGADTDEYSFRDDVEDYEEEQEIGMATRGRGTTAAAPGGVGGGGAGATQVGGIGPAPKGPPKIDRARTLFQQLMNRGDLTRADIIAQFVERLDVTESTAVSYYERLAKEFGLTAKKEKDDDDFRQKGFGDPERIRPAVGQLPADTDFDMEGEPDPSGDPGRAGLIRTVDNAHLVYKRQEEDGTFEELWVYNVGDQLNDELTIRRAILAGTDIPQGKTRSEDGTQSYTVTTMGNAQLVHIIGLPN